MHFCKRNGETKLYQLAAISFAFISMGQLIYTNENECGTLKRSANRVGSDLCSGCQLSPFCRDLRFQDSV
jgi:hypothetical protein